jgi:hypothetical protein
MNRQNPLSNDSSAQMILLVGFIIALVIIGMGTTIYSVASSNSQPARLQSSVDAYDSFTNIKEEYGKVLMFGSGSGAYTPFNSSNTTVRGFESNMIDIMGSHGYILNFTWNYYLPETPPTAEVTIQLFDGMNRFEDTISYNLRTGRIRYDLIPPGNITDLTAVTGAIDGEIDLSWTASGDDFDMGIASKYDLRYSSQPIDTMAKFDNATFYPVNFNPDISGTDQEFTVHELDPGIYYFAIVVYDEVLHASDLSNCPNAVAANWRPSVEYIIADDSVNSSTNLTTQRGSNVTIMFNVTDKDQENLDISLWLDNGSGWYASVNEFGLFWNDYNNTIYNHTIYHINTTWKYYVNVTDGIPGHDVTAPPGAPASYYFINGTNSTTAGTVSIQSKSSSTFNLSAPYSGDFNNNNNISVQYKVNTTTIPWLSSNIMLERHLLEYLIYIGELNNTQRYDINVTFVDYDGIYPASNVTQIIWNQTLT